MNKNRAGKRADCRISVQYMTGEQSEKYLISGYCQWLNWAIDQLYE